MSAAVINQVFSEESGRIAPDLLVRTSHVSPWLSLVPTGLFPDGIGSTIKVQTVGRVIPTDGSGNMAEPTWTDIANSGYGGAGGSCIPTATTLLGGNTRAEFKLAQTALESESFCIQNLRSAYDLTEQMNALKKGLSDATKIVMVERARSEFARLCTNHLLVAANGVTESTTMPSGSGKSPGVVTSDLLTDCYENLNFRGAGESNLLLREDGHTIFPFFTSMFASKAIKDETQIHTDYRYVPAVQDELTKVYAGLGAMSKPLLGFQHIIDPTPPRWEYSGGWRRVWPYIAAAGDNGTVYVPNPAYRTAAWEDSFIFHPEVMTMLFPNSITTAGSGTSFQPVQYRGEWRWVNVENHDTSSAAYNPDGLIGKFRGNFASGAKPGFTDYGYRIRHARCRDLASFYAACS